MIIKRRTKLKETDVWMTIIIPVYNAQQYLYKCLSSITSQSFQAYEVILVDDGSTDKSAEICEEFCSKDNRMKYFKTKNEGAFHARVFGAKKAGGRYFTFCDADDYYSTSNAFKLLYEKASSVAQGYSLIQFGFYKKFNHLKRSVKFVRKDLVVNETEFDLHEYPKLLCSFAESSHLNTSCCNKLYSNKLLENLPEEKERVFWGDDEILNMYLLQDVERALFLPDLLYVYRQSSGGTGKFSLRTMNDLDIIKKHQLEFIKRREGEDTERMLRTLHAETAAWFLVYLRQARNYLTDSELEELISKTLQLPRFILAREYFADHPENWNGPKLLVKGDVKEYLAFSREQPRKPFMERLKETLIFVYKRI